MHYSELTIEEMRMYTFAYLYIEVCLYEKNKKQMHDNWTRNSRKAPCIDGGKGKTCSKNAKIKSLQHPVFPGGDPMKY